MAVIITTETVDVTIDGTTIKMKGDPSGTEAWAELMEMETDYENAEQRAAVLEKILVAFEQMAVDQENRDQLRGLFSGDELQYRGVLTLKSAVEGYIKEVTHFPTEPSKPSRKR